MFRGFRTWHEFGVITAHDTFFVLRVEGAGIYSRLTSLKKVHEDDIEGKTNDKYSLRTDQRS